MRLPVIGLVATAVTSSLLFAPPSYGAEGFSITQTGKGTINLKADNTPLNEVVRGLGVRCGFDLKGMSPSNERVSMQLSNTSVDETLRKLLRGFNYVLIKAEGSARGSLMVLGKTERVVHTYAPPSAAPVPMSAIPQVSSSAPVPAGEQPSVMTAHQGFPSSPAGIPGPNATGQRSTFSSGSTTQAQSAGTSVASVQTSSAAGTSAATSESLAPPGPPQIPGLDMPPMVPAALAEMGLGRSVSTASHGSSFGSAVSSAAQTSSVSQQTAAGSSGSTGTAQSGTSSTALHDSTTSSTVGGSSASTSDTSQTHSGGAQMVIPGTGTSTGAGAITSTTVDLRPPQIPF